MSNQDDFNWNDVEEGLVVPEQFAIAVYNNPRNDLVIRQAGRYGNDEDHFVVIHPSHAQRTAKTAAERQRRRREKQRERDNVTEAVTKRDNDRDSVTTAPAVPELDLHGGEHQALTH
jgi:hypothetical protein